LSAGEYTVFPALRRAFIAYGHTRLWTELLGVFGPARSTNAFLSIGTGIPKKEEIWDPAKAYFSDTVETFATVATDSQITHMLFRTLLDAFAPRPAGRKYWRLNIGTPKGDWDEHTDHWYTPWNRPKTRHHQNDYENIGNWMRSRRWITCIRRQLSTSRRITALSMSVRVR
jgi:hypothetical protein